VTAPVLVVGSYPPIPVPGAPVTVAEVRRVWAEGGEVTVVAPRLSASHLAVPIWGPLAGRRLDNVRRHTGARRLVLVVEDGFPFPAGRRLRQMATAAVLVRALARFEHVRLVRAGPVTGLWGPAWARVAAAATEVVTVEPGPASPGVTPLGPPEVTVADRARRAGRPVKRLLRKGLRPGR